jgi:glycosyltransferase involved in cell wall biosynthesis
MKPLVVVTTHPIQYHVPVYKAVENLFGVPVHIIYGSDFSVAGYYDKEFRSTFAWDVDLASKNSVASTFLCTVANGGARGYDELSAAGLRKALIATDPGAILLTGYRPSFNSHAIYHALRMRRPLLFRAETTDHARARGGLLKEARPRALRWFYNRCDRLLPIGARSYAHYRALGCEESKLIFSPYCVDTAPFQCDEPARAALRQATRAQLQLPDASRVLLFSGKLSQRKGVHQLLAAVKQFPAELRAKTALVFLGDGQERPALEAEALRDPAVRAVFLGFQNQTQLSPYYQSADLLVLPSVESETWGLVVNEALHHGLPAVVSDAVGCAPDLIQPGCTGEIAAANSVESLREALLRALAWAGDPALRARRREKIAGYTVEKAAQGIARAFLAVTGKDRASNREWERGTKESPEILTR